VTAEVTQFDHPLRRELYDEVHARPSLDLPTPAAISYVARVAAKPGEHGAKRQMLSDLLAHYDRSLPSRDVNAFTADLGELGLRWERHTEYARYSFVDVHAPGDPFEDPPFGRVPGAWRKQLYGQLIVAAHAFILPLGEDDEPDYGELSRRYFDGNVLVGSGIADRAGIALTDVRVQPDGFSRLLVFNRSMSGAQCGRNLQRLLEIETYRMMMLLAFPLARELTPLLGDSEQELAAIGEALVDSESVNEQRMLERLTLLAAENQTRHLRSDYRFAAAHAYYDIVEQRIDELREERLPGIQTFREFNARRLRPAFKTFQATSARQGALVERLSRATQLLSTRVDIARQQQNQSLLESMNRRAEFQLRLQATVEGLSVAAVTYYVVGLVGTASQGLAAFGIELDRNLVMAISIPIVAGVAFLGIRRIRKGIARGEAG